MNGCTNRDRELEPFERLHIGYDHSDMHIEVEVIYNTSADPGELIAKLDEDLSHYADSCRRNVQAHCSNEHPEAKYWGELDKLIMSDKMDEFWKMVEAYQIKGDKSHPKKADKARDEWSNNPFDGDYHGWGGVPDD